MTVSLVEPRKPQTRNSGIAPAFASPPPGFRSCLSGQEMRQKSREREREREKWLVFWICVFQDFWEKCWDTFLSVCCCVVVGVPLLRFILEQKLFSGVSWSGVVCFCILLLVTQDSWELRSGT